MHSAFILFIYFAFLYFSLSLKWILRRVGNSEGSSQGALGALAAKQTPATAGKQLEQCPPNKPCCSALAPGHAEVSFVSPPQKKNKKNSINLPSLRGTVRVFRPNAATGWRCHI